MGMWTDAFAFYEFITIDVWKTRHSGRAWPILRVGDDDILGAVYVGQRGGDCDLLRRHNPVRGLKSCWYYHDKAPLSCIKYDFQAKTLTLLFYHYHHCRNSFWNS